LVAAAACSSCRRLGGGVTGWPGVKWRNLESGNLESSLQWVLSTCQVPFESQYHTFTWWSSLILDATVLFWKKNQKLGVRTFSWMLAPPAPPAEQNNRCHPPFYDPCIYIGQQVFCCILTYIYIPVYNANLYGFCQYRERIYFF
jgi:hypothetical protein